MMPASRLAGSSTETVVRCCLRSTPTSSSVSLSLRDGRGGGHASGHPEGRAVGATPRLQSSGDAHIFFFLAFMMFGSVAYLHSAAAFQMKRHG